MLFFLQLGLILAKIEEPATPLVVLLGVMLVGLFLAGALYLFSLPYMVLAFNSPLIASGGKLGFEGSRMGSAAGRGVGRWAIVPPGTPLSTAPTSKAVDAGDVVGRWQFYLDRLSRRCSSSSAPTALLPRRSCPTRGRRKNYPGGTWRLEGPGIHLDGYVTATEEATNEARTWWVINTTSGPALYGGDGDRAQRLFLPTGAQGDSKVHILKRTPAPKVGQARGEETPNLAAYP